MSITQYNPALDQESGIKVSDIENVVETCDNVLDLLAELHESLRALDLLQINATGNYTVDSCIHSALRPMMEVANCMAGILRRHERETKRETKQPLPAEEALANSERPGYQDMRDDG